jgi:elongation factor P
MVLSNQIIPGMTLSIGDKLFRVESAVKVTVTKGAPFIKTKLKNLLNNQSVEKNFKLDQTVKEVSLLERTLEFLYLEGDDFLFLDINNLDQVLVPSDIVEQKSNYLKEGVQVKGSFYGETVFSVELPEFLELMVSRTEGAEKGNVPVSNASKVAILETGARISVPPFIEAGDVIKVSTDHDEGGYIQRV